MPESAKQAKHLSVNSKRCYASRTLKAVVFAACLIGFFYQVIEFCTHFLTYPAFVHIDFISLDSFQIPAITFCNTNPVQRSKFCDKYPTRCETPEDMDKFCNEFHHYCQGDISDFKIPKMEYQSESLKYPYGLTERDVMELYQNTSEFDVTDRWTNNVNLIKNSFKNFQRFFLSASGKELHLCYTDHNLYINKLEPIYKENSESFGMYILDVQPSESFRIAEKYGMRMAIHSPFESTDPFVKGTPLTPGTAYKFRIRLEKELLLPYPYKTDCINYFDLWLKSGKTEPRSQQMCRDNCQRTFNKVCYGCEKNLAVYMEGDEVCPMNEDISCKAESRETLFEILKSCKSLCKKDCIKMKYHYSYEEIPETFLEVTNLILIKISVEYPLEAKILTHVPQYQNVEIFSYIGGFMGCWMGLSIWSLVTSFDTLLRPLKITRRRNLAAPVNDIENK